MTKHEGYQCDGGCGMATVIDPSESLTRSGWFITYAPKGWPTLHTCSPECLVRALEHHGMRGLRLPEGPISG